MQADESSAADAAGQGPESGSSDNRSSGTSESGTPASRPPRRRRVRQRPQAEGEPTTKSSVAAGGEGGERKPRRRRSRRGGAAADTDRAERETAGSRADGDGSSGDRPARKRSRRRRRGRDTETDSGEGQASGARAPAGEETLDAAAQGRKRRALRRRKALGKEGEGAAGEAAGRNRDAKDGEEKRGKSGRGAKRDRQDKRDRKDKRGRKDKREARDGRGGRDRKGRGDRKGRRGRDRDGRRDQRSRDPRAIDIIPRLEAPRDEPVEKLLLVNASDREEARIALMVNGRLEEVYIEALRGRSMAGNIYRGRIQNVEKGIGAAFVDIGRGLTGFLHASDMPLAEGEERGGVATDRLSPGDEVIVQITRDGIGRKGPALTGRISLPGRYLVLMPFTNRSGISRRIPRGPERERMRMLLQDLEVPGGMGVIVRTASETTDLAALSADLQHLVVEWERICVRTAEPGHPGVLRGESDIAERSVRDIMPSDVTRIVVDNEQTAGRIHQLLRIWYPSETAAAAQAGHLSIQKATEEAETPVGELRAGGPDNGTAAGEVASGESDEVPAEAALDPDAPEPEAVEADVPEAEGAEPDLERLASSLPEDELLGDELDDTDDVDEEDDDDEDVESAEDRDARLEEHRRLAKIIPEVLIHTEDMPIFHAYDVEPQLEDAYRRATRLPSGGSIVIDPTEALVAVDVNSGRLTDAEDPEATALRTNLEALDEAARQLRLRDLGGLVVLDLIDMRERKSRRQVEKALRDALSRDRARIRLGRMGPFGCVILSRQRIRRALTRITHEDCEPCGGTGRRRVTAGLGLRVLREMQARVARSRGRGGLAVRAPDLVIAWVHKHRASLLKQLKRQCSGPVSLSADPRLAVDGWAMKGTPPTDGSAAP